MLVFAPFLGEFLGFFSAANEQNKRKSDKLKLGFLQHILKDTTNNVFYTYTTGFIWEFYFIITTK